MNLIDFQKLRSGLQANAHPGSRFELNAVENSFRDVLRASGAFEDVEVEHTDDPDRLVIALCTFKAEYDERGIADLVAATWRERIRYTYWDASAVLVEDDHVELQAATRHSHTGHYVTLHVVAQKAEQAALLAG
ncbi:MAG TPA: hypothetical protein VFG63_10495 [Nocardioidaceae bacterium]|nr:hypothetical protein [Nocardioidaceae bacterium]